MAKKTKAVAAEKPPVKVEEPDAPPFYAMDGRVIVKQVVEEQSEGGIILPPTAKPGKGAHVGLVVAVGRGILLDSGIRDEIALKPGDRVMFDEQHGNQFFEFGGVKYCALTWRSVYVRLK